MNILQFCRKQYNGTINVRNENFSIYEKFGKLKLYNSVIQKIIKRSFRRKDLIIANRPFARPLKIKPFNLETKLDWHCIRLASTKVCIQASELSND